jgi:predicted metal-dependent HD superfamily phosphohydrolase
MNYLQILHETAVHVRHFFNEYPNASLLYHNLAHTEDVVNNALQIAAHYQLPDEDNFVIHTAAWFHDMGYLTGTPAEHEARSAQLANAFLTGQQVPDEVIQKIESCILSTRMPQSPKTLNEQIICDADLFNLGHESFREKSKTLRREKELLDHIEITGNEWRSQTISLFHKHQYFTSYAQALLQKGKSANLLQLEEMQEKKKGNDKKEKKKKHKTVTEVVAEPVTIKENKPTAEEKLLAKEEKKNLPGRGIETMFRLTSANHLELSAMADNKANILVTVNSIIITVIISVLFRHIETSPHLMFPAIIFLASTVGAIIFSVLATRPNINPGKFSKEDINARKTNLLFFGNFYKMNLQEYEWAMKEMINDREYLYGSLIKDIYFLGVVLGRKYRLIRIAYNIFMYGIIISVLAFAIAIFFFKPETGPIN